MRRYGLLAILAFGLFLVSPPGYADEPATGWRGNGTGLWPECNAPTTWSRTALGALQGMRNQANRPAPADEDRATLVKKGLPGEWLLLGPLPLEDSVKEFDRDLLAGEATAAPTAGEQQAGQTWRQFTAPFDDPMIFGTAELPWVALQTAKDFAPNKVAYAFTNLYSPRGGPARIVVDHGFGLKIWLNGKEIYREPERHVALGYYTAISRNEFEHIEPQSPKLDIQLTPGWNRLLLKVTSANKDTFHEMGFCLRVIESPDVKYESQNIRWMTELPARSTSTPILVGDRIFLAAEPDLLVCIDKHSGKTLWTAANNYYEALTPAERAANPAFAEKVEPIAAALRTEPDRVRRVELRHQMQAALLEIDTASFRPATDGHFEAHFGIVGYSMPTPVSDGKFVYTWCGVGVAACYDLEGNRQWITRVPLTDPIAYGSSPSLADGVLAVYLGKLYGLDAKTGELRWTQHRISKNIAAVLAATFGGEQVFVSYLGEVIRPSDGKLLYRSHEATSGDSGAWGPPLVLGNKMFVPKYGVLRLSVLDFSQAPGNGWKPETIAAFDLPVPDSVHHRANGEWLDRSSAGSPLVHEGLAYGVDIYGWLYVTDLATQQVVYHRDLGIDGLMHYNAVPVAASATLIGKNVVVLDNQGTAIVLVPGREYKEIARNKIETLLDRPWPIPAQETLAYAPPIADADCLYLRGERYLYCIGAK